MLPELQEQRHDQPASDRGQGVEDVGVDTVDVIPGAGSFERDGTHTGRQRRIQQEPLHGGLQRDRIPGRDEVAVLAVDHGLAATRCIGGDDGTTHGHGFQHRAGGTLAPRWQDVDRCLSQCWSHVVQGAQPGQAVISADEPRMKYRRVVSEASRISNL